MILITVPYSFQIPNSVGVEDFFEVRFQLIMLCSMDKKRGEEFTQMIEMGKAPSIESFEYFGRIPRTQMV